MISIKFWQNINQELSKLNSFINSENILETLLKNVSLCELLTAFAKFPKYVLSFIRYSTLKSSRFMFKIQLKPYMCHLLFIFLDRESNSKCSQW